MKDFTIQQGSLYVINCGGIGGVLGGARVAFIVDALSIDLDELISTITGLAVVNESGGRTNRFTAV